LKTESYWPNRPKSAKPKVIAVVAHSDRNRGEAMELTAVVVALVIGALAGWLAGLLVQGAGFGLLGNIVVGIAGAMAALLFPRLGAGLTLGGGLVGAILTSTIGAVILLLIVNLIQRLAS
jgi:uncharacterized membrane protein YeaQ/YmgE (transglycosylase-associated protein family)